VDVKKPPTVIGRTTVGAMQSGLFYGYVGMVEGLMQRMSAELGGNALCVATGGLAVTIASEIPAIEHVDVDLTLRGLRMVWERNQPITAAR
jgi:type III pantothenate kinase